MRSIHPEQSYPEEWSFEIVAPPKQLTVFHKKGATVMRLLTEGPRPSIDLQKVPAGPVDGPTMLLLGSVAVRTDAQLDDLSEGRLVQGEYIALGETQAFTDRGCQQNSELIVLEGKIESVQFGRSNRH